MLKVAIAGYGVVGKRRSEIIRSRNDAEIVGICDVSDNARMQAAQIADVFATVEELFASKSFDCLFVCLSNDKLVDVTILALRSGVHVFCEKPPARNLAELERVGVFLKTNPDSPKVLYGFNHRYHDSVICAQKELESGIWGDIINLKGTYGKSQIISFDQTDWRTKKSIAGGGILLDQGIHMVDLMRLFVPSLQAKASIVSNSHWRYSVEDNVYALLESECGKVAMLHSSATSWHHRFALEITLTKGTISLSGLITGTKSYGLEKLTKSLRDKDRIAGVAGEEVLVYTTDPSWRREIDCYFKFIADDVVPEHGTFDDAYRTLQLVEEIYRIGCQ